MAVAERGRVRPQPADRPGARAAPTSLAARIAAQEVPRLPAWLLRFLVALSTLALQPTHPAFAALSPAVTSVRFGLEQDRTRIVLELDGPAAFSVNAIDEPPRLVIDLPEVAWRLRQDRPSDLRGLAAGFRYGRFDVGRSRLVVDVAAPFRIVDQFMLPPRDGMRTFRLVVDIEPAAGIPAPGTPGGAALAAVTPPRDPPAAVVEQPRRQPAAKPLPSAEKPLIVLDPGHGGVDPGARAITGADEKDITLAFALGLREQLLRTGRYRVAMTRESDDYVALRDRIRIGRDAGADLFISLHADSIPDGSARGASVYTLSAQASDAEAARLAAAENKADILAGADLSYQDPLLQSILIDLSQSATNNQSIAFAEALVGELGAVTALVRNTRRYAGFVVLKSPDTPSVLVELGYLSDRDDARALADSGKRARLGAALVRAVDQHFGFHR